MKLVQVIISKEIDIENEETMAKYLNNGILKTVTDDDWIIDNVSII